MPFPPNAAHFDGNQVPTIMGVVGSAGTSDTGGTALHLPIGVRESTGAMYVFDTAPGGAAGTMFAEDAAHTSGDGGRLALAVRTDGGTALAADGDYHVLELDANGALRISGTVATGAGTQAVRIIDGTTTLVSTVTSLSVGTIGGKAASGAAAVANPVLIAGTDAGGTVYAPLVSSAGAVSVTGASAGTFGVGS